MGIVKNEVNVASRGGTELMMERLEAAMPPELFEQFQIVPSRLRAPLDETKIRILWCHDTADDPEVSHLANEGWRKWHRIVFVSHQQQGEYIRRFGIPWSKCMVMQNAIEPIEWVKKPQDGTIRLVYTPTPHRGLNVLVAAFTELAKKIDDIELDVFSSFELYGWSDRDQHFKELFDACRDHPKINYMGTVSNDEVRAALQKSHVFAYPSIWQETSCLCLIEAMSADLVCVHSSLGALPETSGNWNVMYPFHEDLSYHAGAFMHALEVGITEAKRRLGSEKPSLAKTYADIHFDWKVRADNWKVFLTGLVGEPREIPREDDFVYRIG